MNSYLIELARRAAATFPDQNVSAALDRYRAIVGPTPQQGSDAEAALRILQQNGTPSPRQIEALEKLIRMMRPVVFVRDREADPLAKSLDPSFPEWKNFSTRLRPLAYSVGAIFWDRSSTNPVATGFLVGDRLLLTNKHVLMGITFGTTIINPETTRVGFEQEWGRNDALPKIAVERCVAFHPDHDLALLLLASSPNAPSLRFAPTGPDVGQRIAAVGYPMSDTDRNPFFVNALFDGVFGVKRAAPGLVLATSESDVHHDCSTLGGNSGSPIFALDSDEVVAVHKEGYFLVRNGAVPAPVASAFVAQHGGAA
jgi:hypothetical protein